ncbi:hypothetical protein FA13DRAFT_1785688 [Coprinellus micaceus]|uniref:Uncharacterized protein n=1 Tax=Coprinellus micaceus TaxID=71717 RepID=A0A4Y7TW00_COPMI|nr:hypothetical protein FA13DRAFT_1785688 [Coprinellus micaceus]
MSTANAQCLLDNLNDVVEALRMSYVAAQREVARMADVAEGLQQELFISEIEEGALRERVAELGWRLKDATGSRWETLHVTEDPATFIRTSYWICPQSGDLMKEVRSETRVVPRNVLVLEELDLETIARRFSSV